MSEDEQEKQAEIDVRRVREVLDQPGEHFETVQVFVTRYEPQLEGATMNLSLGSGNWFTRYGQVKEWALKREEESRLSLRE